MVIAFSICFPFSYFPHKQKYLSFKESMICLFFCLIRGIAHTHLMPEASDRRLCPGILGVVEEAAERPTAPLWLWLTTQRGTKMPEQMGLLGVRSQAGGGPCASTCRSTWTRASIPLRQIAAPNKAHPLLLCSPSVCSASALSAGTLHIHHSYDPVCQMQKTPDNDRSHHHYIYPTLLCRWVVHIHTHCTVYIHSCVQPPPCFALPCVLHYESCETPPLSLAVCMSHHVPGKTVFRVIEYLYMDGRTLDLIWMESVLFSSRNIAELTNQIHSYRKSVWGQL